jgi:hypothetical protein
VPPVQFARSALCARHLIPATFAEERARAVRKEHRSYTALRPKMPQSRRGCSLRRTQDFAVPRIWSTCTCPVVGHSPFGM